MILHDFPYSSASYRVRIALALKGLPYERRNHALRAGEQRAAAYLALNPAGMVPALEADGLVLTQSIAIIDYLDAVAPAPRLIPIDPAPRARAMAMALAIACDVHPLNNLRVLLYLEERLGLGADERRAWYGHWIAAGFDALEAMLAAGPATAFACGEEPGIVDCCLVPQVFNARRFHVDLAPWPLIVERGDRAAALPAFAAAAPPPAA